LDSLEQPLAYGARDAPDCIFITRGLANVRARLINWAAALVRRIELPGAVCLVASQMPADGNQAGLPLGERCKVVRVKNEPPTFITAATGARLSHRIFWPADYEIDSHIMEEGVSCEYVVTFGDRSDMLIGDASCR
jgi:hypothetical protein